MLLSPLPVSFYSQTVFAVARQLLGARLVRALNGDRLTGYIIETEAYAGESDLACHARAGRTPRTEVMYGPPGHAYIYFIYGMHWMLNCVAEAEGAPTAVLIRALLPIEGLDQMARGRITKRPQLWTDGPAKLCKTLAIDGRLNGVDLTRPDGPLWIEPGQAIPDYQVIYGPRVGIENVPEPWRSQPWRYRVDLKNSPFPTHPQGTPAER